jgi:putative CocE/NonD family hydrolase
MQYLSIIKIIAVYLPSGLMTMYQVTKKTASMLTRDGIRLDADVYYPHDTTKESFPVLLMRQPYGRAIASTVVYAHPRWYARHGYIVVIQDVRGRGTSEGEFRLFENEIEDGYDTLTWVSQLPDSNGRVGMYGFSYQGMTQLYAAASKHPALKTICPSMIANDLYSDWAYENGAFCYQLNLAWAIQLAAETARLKGDLTAYKVLFLASRNLPLYDHPNIFTEALRKYIPSNFYYQWLNHPENDEYWQNLSPKTHLKNVDLPMLHSGGWFDPYLRGTLNLYQEMRAKSQFTQYLIIGPWGHLPWGNKLGDRNYGDQANSPIDELQITWFNHFLKDIKNSQFESSSLRLFEMNSNQWIEIDNLDNQNQIVYSLNSNGLNSVNTNSGKLLLIDNDSKNIEFEDILVCDFWRATPSLGGHAVIPAGSFERSELDNRSDILTYTSEPLKEDLVIVGEIELEINCYADSSSFDLCAVISEVFPDGRVYNFSQGYIKVKAQQQTIKFTTQSTCIKIPKSHAIRLSLSVASFPAYSLNLSRDDYGLSQLNLDGKILTLIVNSGRLIINNLELRTQNSELRTDT